MTHDTTGDNDEILASITDAATLLRMSVRTVQRRIDSGKLSARLHAGRRLVVLSTKDIPKRVPPAIKARLIQGPLSPDAQRDNDTPTTLDAPHGDTSDITAEITARIDRLEGMLLGGFMAGVATRDDLATVTAAVENLSEALRSAVENSNAATVDDVAELAALVKAQSAMIEEQRTQVAELRAELAQQRGGFWQRLFRRE